MNKFIISILLLLSASVLKGQALQTKWAKSIAGNLYEQSNSIAVAPCGDVYTVGFFQQRLGNLTSVGTEDGFIAKYTTDGQLIWLKQLGGNSADRLNGITIIDDNTIVVAGEMKGVLYYGTDSLVAQDRLDAVVLQIDSSGQINWAKQAGGMGDDSAIDVVANIAGTVWVTGYYENDLSADNDTVFSYGTRDAFVWKLNPNGTTVWLSHLGGPGFDEGVSIAIDSHLDCYVTGSFRDIIYTNQDTAFGNLSNDIFVVKYDNNGNATWVRTMGGPSSDRAQCVAVDGQDNICLTGWYNAYLDVDTVRLADRQEEDIFLVKMNSMGDLLWAKDVAYRFDERGYEVDFDAQNNVYLMGTLDSFLIIEDDSLYNRHLNRPTDIFIAKFSPDGDYKWSQTLGHYYNDFCYDMVVVDASELYITGSFQDTTIYIGDTLISQGQFDVFIAKFEMDTILQAHKIPTSSVLHTARVYPNPSLGKMTLEYQLSEPSVVQIVLYDWLGRPIKHLLDEEQQRGAQQLEINGKGLPKGYYILKIATEGTIFAHKVIFE